MALSQAFTAFAEKNTVDITAFKQCETETASVISKIKGLYEVPPFSPDEDMVVYGSLARGECVKGSDVDWTLLADGQANPRHPNLVTEARKKLKGAGFPDPGTSGMFGQVSFSHELIHNIGGQSDTNHNLTKRILLLLESAKIMFDPDTNDNAGSAYDRIIKGILSQYIEHDSGLYSGREAIPRFLLNDIVRYWRTMCVDFAYKQKEQEGEKWALRNIKLRMSRKLLYVKGMLMCFKHFGANTDKIALIGSLNEMVPKTPIELLIELQDHFNLETTDICKVINSYNSFLVELNNETTRERLGRLPMKKIYDDEVFKSLRETANEMQDALDNLFIHNESGLQVLTIKYAIF